MTSILGSEWHLSSPGINIVTENGCIKDYNKILTQALNTDIKEIGSPFLTSELAKDRTSKIVLQIQKIRNVSAPKANESSQAAPRMLKLNLTDGDNYVQALEISTVNSISRENTPPGSKILLNNAKICSGYILIDSKTCTVLGGKVPHLYEKWEIAKSIQRNNRRVSGEDGPPPWVNFGCKIQTGNQEGNFKSLGKNKEDNTNSEFEQQRQGAIAEATSGAVRKVFGGRVKQNVQPITYNPRDRQDKSRPKSKFVQKEKDMEEKPLKPSDKVSLFAFLEDKLPLNDNQTTAKAANTYNLNSARSQQGYFKNNESQNKALPKEYNKDYTDYNQQNRRDNRQSNYNNEKVSTQNKYEPKQYNYNKQNITSSRYEKPQNKLQDHSMNSKPYQADNDNINTSSNEKDKDVNELSNNITKLSVNSQFATRSLRQHLNLGQLKKNDENTKQMEKDTRNSWNIGEECMAKYWEDGKYYNAIVTAITDKTYAVKFKGYGNIEEVLKTDCLPVTSNNKHYNSQTQQYRKPDQAKPYPGSMEFRRSARNYK